VSATSAHDGLLEAVGPGNATDSQDGVADDGVHLPEATATPLDTQFKVFPRALHKRAWDLIRAAWVTDKMGEDTATKGPAGNPAVWAERRNAARDSFQQLDGAGRSELARRVALELQSKGGDQDLALCLQQKADHLGQQVFVDRKNCVLLTYNGDWHLFADMDVPRPLLECATAPDSVAVWLRGNRAVAHLWDRFLTRLGELSATLRVSRWSAALEICPQTLAKGRLRVHAHVFLEAHGPMKLRSASALQIEGRVPHLNTHHVLCIGARGKAHRTAAAAGHYYIRCPKIGSIFSTGTHEPYHDYPIKAEWITSYWQAEKLSDTNAIQEYVKCKRDCVRNVNNVKENMRLRRTLASQGSNDEVQQRLHGLKRPRVYVEAVEKVFLPQFANMTLSRRKFLVLEGPSCVGKTEYARGLVACPTEVLELNCVNQKQFVDLRALSPGVHKLLLWDEAEPSLILNNKKLIQGQAVEVQMGMSSTSCHGYSIFPWGLLMVICSNTWSWHTRSLPHEDAQWLASNSIHVMVTSPLWQK
jgi:hypothetical protein